MRHRARLASVLLLAVAAMGAEAVGCVDRYDPSEGCEGPACTTGGGAGGQLDPTKNCDLTDKTLPPDGSCGVFVRSSAAAGGDGSKERPFQSFAEAAATSPKRIYACGEMGATYSEDAGVIFNDGVKIYGGFTACDGAWTWSPEARAALQGPADAIALTLNGGNNRLENLDVIAADASAAGADSPGRSSIALLANGGAVTIVNSRLEAGEATNGAQAGTIAEDRRLDGTNGDPGLEACSPGATHGGPAGPVTQCADGQSEGGKGGDGGTVTGTVAMYDRADAGDGTSGKPAGSQPAQGAAGTGETAGQLCTEGKNGAPGDPGEPARPSEGLGAIDANGYTGAPAERGGTGRPGQGGGGGGGARGTAGTCGGSTTRVLLPGASGGAGGSGGCGGQGGHAGHPGGSSIALVVVEATVSLDGVSLVASDAGDGGPGGEGQLGGSSSSGGARGARAGDAKESCAGGSGGPGGNGGPGGGGHGGHALGVALRAGELRGISNVSFTPGDAGTGAPGAGIAPDNGASGANGLAEECWNFADNTACSATAQP